MYSKWGLMDHARRVFDEIPQPDVVSWNTMINGYVSSGSDSLAFDWFLKMVSCGVVPDEFGSSAVLKACSGLGDVCGGARVHCVAIKSGICGSAFVGCGLVEFYAGFGFYEDSMRVFDEMVFKDVVLVNAVIGVQAKIGHLGGAFLNFRWMLSSSMAPARASFVNLMMAVINGSCGDFRPGEQVHGLVVKSGFEGDGVIENSLVRMYTSCGSVGGGFDLLVHSGSNNLMSWTTLISGCADLGCFREAMEAFCWIFGEAFSVDSVLISCILGVSAVARCIGFGTQGHSIVLKNGYETDICVMNSLMDMYAKCSSMMDAMKIFQQISNYRDLFSWTIVISGNVRNGFQMEALLSFKQMRKEGVTLDASVCCSILMGCTDMQPIRNGEQIHCYVIKSGCQTDVLVQTALLSLYANHGNLESVYELFQKMNAQDVVSWTALISGSSKVGCDEIALLWLLEMLWEGVMPNQFTLTSALASSARLTATELGRSLHSRIIKTGFKEDKFIGCALIDMYSKCGIIEDAVAYFNEIPKQDVALWNSVLAGHAHNGNVLELLNTFEDMQLHKMNPDELSFLALLSGCSHGGHVDMAVQYYMLMKDEYGIVPKKEHHSCIIDALGRAGLFRDALLIIERLGFDPGPEVLRTLINSCIVHRHIRLGLSVAAKMVVLGATDASSYVLLAKLYAVNGRWNDARNTREAMDRSCSKGKKVGRSWIESKCY
ncbi:Pentatricopeptide repeat-containing protein [Acorus gramineus]|uniref:Pentatricopeptide repeat-containing protein n=1 Tax=Acorus gramineus TaxID=55184 RepID=A0AAV9BK75_ACOGR|nr:Pentatricopeptide repeat-containing protein [Acorus gramineus]